MSRLVTAVRFLMGLSMVAGGATLAGPYLSAVTKAAIRQHAGAKDAAAAVAAAPPAAWVVEQPAPAAAVPAESAVAGMPAAQGIAFSEEALPIDSGNALPPRAEYQPPVPPMPLPPLAAEIAAAGPEVDGTYRSTLDIPPPPLLDAHRPPPLAVGWSAHDVARPPAPPLPPMPAAVIPPTYVVRDGDDLAGIGTRFYGHPSAAGAIWAANRDRLADPGILPIGAELVLPPSWTVASQRATAAGGGAAIEPSYGGAAEPRFPPATPVGLPVGGWRTHGSPPAMEPPAAPSAAPWLANGQRAAAPPPAAVARPAAVQVAPGETLASLGQRFYGDPQAAERIWQANRDRLRSPELIVPGMELRLP